MYKGSIRRRLDPKTKKGKMFCWFQPWRHAQWSVATPPHNRWVIHWWTNLHTHKQTVKFMKPTLKSNYTNRSFFSGSNLHRTYFPLISFFVYLGQRLFDHCSTQLNTYALNLIRIKKLDKNGMIIVILGIPTLDFISLILTKNHLHVKKIQLIPSRITCVSFYQKKYGYWIFITLLRTI